MPRFIQLIAEFDDQNRPQTMLVDIDEVAVVRQIGSVGSKLILKDSGIIVATTAWESEIQYILDSRWPGQFQIARYDGRLERKAVDRYRVETLGWPDREGRRKEMRVDDVFSAQTEHDKVGRTTTPVDRVGPDPDEDRFVDHMALPDDVLPTCVGCEGVIKDADEAHVDEDDDSWHVECFAEFDALAAKAEEDGDAARA